MTRKHLKWIMYFVVYGSFAVLVGRIWFFHDQNQVLSKRLHKLYDKNRNMKLEIAELISFLGDHGVELTEAQQKLWIQDVDDEKDGFDVSETHEVLMLFDELPTASESLKSFSYRTRNQVWLDVLLLGLLAIVLSLLTSQAENIQKTMMECSWYTGFRLLMLRRRGNVLVENSQEIKQKRSNLALEVNVDESEIEALRRQNETAKAQLNSWVKESQKYLEGALRLQSRIDNSGTWWKTKNKSNRDEFATYGIYKERYVFGGIGGDGFFDLNRDESYFGNTCYVCENVQTAKKKLVRIFDVGPNFEGGGLFKSLNTRRAKLEHPNVKCYCKLVATQQLIFLLYDDIYNASLPPSDVGAIIDARGYPLSEAEGRFIFLKVAAAVDHMHGMDLIHGFLCLESVAILGRQTHQYSNLNRELSSDYEIEGQMNEQVVVVDFGTADFSQHGVISTQSILADDFLAPEDIMDFEDGVRLTKARDMWRLGATLYTCLTGELPFSQDCFIDGKWRRSMDRVRLIKGMLHEDNVRWSALSASCCELISALLRSNPDDRLTIEAVKSHSWFHQTDPN